MLPRLMMTAVALGGAAAVAGIGLFGGNGLAVVVVVACCLVGVGWTRLLQVPVGWGVGMIVALTGVATVAVSLWDPPRAPGLLGWLPAVLALGVLVAFSHQMLRRDGRPRLVESVSATVTGQVVVVLGAGWLLALRILAEDGGVNAAASAGVAAAVCAAVVPWPARATVPIGVLGAALAGAAAAGPFASVEVSTGFVIGAAAGLAALGMDVLLRSSATTMRAALSAGMAVVLTAGIAAFAMSRFISGG